MGKYSFLTLFSVLLSLSFLCHLMASLCPAYVQLMSSLCPKWDISYTSIREQLLIIFSNRAKEDIREN